MFPIRDNIPARRPPVVTYALILVNVAVFIYELMLTPRAFEDMIFSYGVVPARFFELAPAEFSGTVITLFTSMFLHGGFLHLIANMWALWLFGDNVEDRMGRPRFLAFYLICGLGAMALHIVLNSDSAVPTIGASGSVSGVMGAYVLFYPMARMIVMVPILFYPLFFELPAVVFLLVWLFMQISGGTAAAAGERVSNVAFWAHIGGLACGVGLGILFARHSKAIPRKYRRGFYRR